MTIDDLWTKMQGEFNQQNEKIDKVMNEVNTIKDRMHNIEEKVDGIDNEIDTIKEKVGDIDVIKEKVSDIDVIKEKVSDIDVIKEKVSEIDFIKEKISDIDFIKEKVSEIDEIKLKVNSIDNKVDVIANSNIAHILYELTRINTDINKKLDTAIEENQVEHKKFEYEISKLNMESKFKYNKG